MNRLSVCAVKLDSEKDGSAVRESVQFIPVGKSSERQVVWVKNDEVFVAPSVYEQVARKRDEDKLESSKRKTARSSNDAKQKVCQSSVEQLLCELSNVFGDPQPTTQQRKPFHIKSAVDCKSIINELEEVGWENIASIDDAFDNVVLNAMDSSGRLHLLNIHLPSNECTNDWSPFKFVCSRSLVDTMKRFQQQVVKLSSLWDELDLLDQTFRILDPPLPAPRSVTRRRVALFDLKGEQLVSTFLEVHLGPDAPRASPCSLEIIGPESIAEPWRKSLDSLVWDEKQTIRDNLINGFQDLGSPLPPSKVQSGSVQATIDEYTRECGICYTYRLVYPDNDLTELPDSGCEKCTRPYHGSCILGWLRALPTTRRSFNIMVGECPYCGEDITVKDG